jgi:decaprenylphospho-beta-D-erythro-pentofuranosid-2-ulose 2-reductase
VSNGASAIVIRASSGLGKALARALAARGFALVIVSRDPQDLEAVAADLRTRFDARCLVLPQDIAAPDWDVEAFAERAAEFLGAIDAVYIPAGCVLDADSGPNPEVLVPLTATNYLGPARLAAAFARRMLGAGKGEIVLCSSIAAGAPRTKNAAYSAAKAALEVYARALRHALEPHGIAVRVYALGYLDTGLAFGQTLRLPLAAPEQIAEAMLRATGRSGKFYLPSFWALVLLVLKHLPWAIYRRLKF